MGALKLYYKSVFLRQHQILITSARVCTLGLLPRILLFDPPPGYGGRVGYCFEARHAMVLLTGL